MFFSKLTLCILEIPKQVLSLNSEEPDEMHHNDVFHQGLHCLLKFKKKFRDIYMS